MALVVQEERAPTLEEAIDLYAVLGLDRNEVWALSPEQQRKSVRAA